MSWYKVLLLPVSLLYGCIMYIRNLLFDHGIISSVSFPVKVISVGNLSLGGTGKTPHTEYLISRLSPEKKIAVLSRGYKRNTRGYRVVTPSSSVAEVGDEPAQIKRKFPDVLVVVHENRRKGIRQILETCPDLDIILLDDAFQHRYVRPDISIVLSSYHHPFFNDRVIPSGHLREWKQGIKRADVLIITKSPEIVESVEREHFLRKTHKYNIPHIFFTHYDYRTPLPVWGKTCPPLPDLFHTVFVLTGIADPGPLIKHLEKTSVKLKCHTYSDHHQFTSAELILLRNDFVNNPSQSKIIITTEKDAIRLVNDPHAKEVLGNLPVFYLPVEVVFEKVQGKCFETYLFDHV